MEDDVETRRVETPAIPPAAAVLPSQPAPPDPDEARTELIMRLPASLAGDGDAPEAESAGLQRIEGPEIVVTANRLGTEPEKVGSSQTVITREELDEFLTLRAYEHLD